MEYQQIAAAGFFPVPSTDTGSLRNCVSWNGAGRGAGGLVFGTLLGPETTGPVSSLHGLVSGTCVSGFLAAPSMHVNCVWGVWYGVVV